MKNMRVKISWLFLIACGLPLLGCGYRSVSYIKEVSTVAVPIFDNQTAYRDLEFELTRAIHNQIKSSTPFRLEPKPERADLLLKGEITSYRKPVAIEGTLDSVLASDILMTVKAVLIDQKTGKTIMEKTYTARADLIPSRMQDESTARARIYEMVSRWVVSLLEQ